MKKHTHADSDMMLADRQIMCDENGNPLVIHQDKIWFLEETIKKGKPINSKYKKYMTTGESANHPTSMSILPLPKKE